MYDIEQFVFEHVEQGSLEQLNKMIESGSAKAKVSITFEIPVQQKAVEDESNKPVEHYKVHDGHRMYETRKRRRYNFGSIERGQYFYAPIEHARDVRSSLSHWCKRRRERGEDYQFITRTTIDGLKVVRIN